MPKANTTAQVQTFVLDELQWIEACMTSRMQATKAMPEPPPPDNESYYGKFVQEHQLSPHERSILAMALLAELDAAALSPLVNADNGFMVRRNAGNNVWVPTGFTCARIMCTTREEQLAYQLCFHATHLFYRKSIISLSATEKNAPVMSGCLKLSPHFRSLFLYGKEDKPIFSSAFPATLLTTTLEWDDLILNPDTLAKIDLMLNEYDYTAELKEKYGLKHVSGGMRVLFCGPSGTGKTLTAALLGKKLGREVYRVDLSAVISKYIGETAQNLRELFEMAEYKDWILFFDEGDALFGKRIDTSATDNKNVHYANQDIAYLLQRIENFNGLVIIASNLEKNMDDAFYRRIEHHIYFNVPNPANRSLLWESILPEAFTYPHDYPLDVLGQYPFTAAIIAKIIKQVCVAALNRNSTDISTQDLDKAIKKELLP